MKLTRRSLTVLALGLVLAGLPLAAQPSRQAAPPATDEAKILEAMHLIQSQPLYDYVKEMVSEKYGGRLTGTKEYEACVAWVESLLKGWGIEPGGENGTYRQLFPNPYTTVFPGGVCEMNVPAGKGGVIKKSYQYEDEFMPGGTTGTGQVTAEVVYVGYGVTAPELGYDDYKGVDVKGKIVLMESEVPVGPGEKTLELFKKWRPYSFHQYKLKNAAAHGAAGMIYNYGPIGNPNNAYVEGFVYHHVGKAVVTDVFAGTGKSHDDVVGRIRKELKPQSFATGKTMTISNKSEHHPDGVGINLLGKITGSDPVLKDEVIIVGGAPRPPGPAVEAPAGRQRQRDGRGGDAGRRRGHGQVRRQAQADGRVLLLRQRGAERGPGDRGLALLHGAPHLPARQDRRVPQHGRPGLGRQDRRLGRHELSQVLGVRREGQQGLHPPGAEHLPGLLPGPAAAGLGLVLLEGRALA